MRITSTAAVSFNPHIGNKNEGTSNCCHNVMIAEQNKHLRVHKSTEYSIFIQNWSYVNHFYAFG